MRISLRNKIALLFLTLIVVSSVATLVAVLVATNEEVERQLASNLEVGGKVFDRILQVRNRQLLDSAQVLTADFGFKQAVATGDAKTIVSALQNHKKRINADLMLLTSLQAELIASTSALSEPAFAAVLTQLVDEAQQDGGLLQVVLLDGTFYQLVVLPVTAPTPLAWAVLGFRIDQAFADELGALTNLHVSFHGERASSEAVLVTDLPGFAVPPQPDVLNAREPVFSRQVLADEIYLSMTTPLVQGMKQRIGVTLSASLTAAYARFDALQLQVVTIATLALLLSMVAAFAIARTVTRPLTVLSEAATQISDGHYDTPIRVNRSSDEIARLAGSFNVMQKGIAEREARILHQYYHDSLTGLPNRLRMVEDLEQWLAQCHAADSLIVASLNINGFKQINKTFGHDVGDQLLVVCAERLQGLVTEQIKVGRVGADEFLLLAYRLDNAQKQTLLDGLLSICDGTFHFGDASVLASSRLGIACYPEHGDASEQLVRRADMAADLAHSRQERLSFYEQGLDEQHSQRILLLHDLNLALDQNQLTMHYQPKLDLASGRVVQAEALIRWFHAERGFIPPDQFIGLAEQSGLMPKLSRWVLKTVINELAQWQRRGVGVGVAVNLSAYDMAQDDLPDYIMALMTQHGLPHGLLTLEITESAVMIDPEHALIVLNRFREAGFLLSIDDYGTGYSSLSQIKRLPVTELKIDRSFVTDLTRDDDDQIIVRSTIDMGHHMGLKVVAEGVEDDDAMALLKRWGCDKVQGYYISKPVASADFLAWLQRQEVTA